MYIIYFNDILTHKCVCHYKYYYSCYGATQIALPTQVQKRQRSSCGQENQRITDGRRTAKKSGRILTTLGCTTATTPRTCSPATTRPHSLR